MNTLTQQGSNTFPVTTQDLLNKSVQGVLLQGKPSLNNNGQCRYRGDYGVCCALGFLIKDDFYNGSLEDQTITTQLGDNVGGRAVGVTYTVRQAVEGSIGRLLTPTEIHMLSSLQTGHDSRAETGMSQDELVIWKDRFLGIVKKVIKSYNLKSPLVGAE